MKEILRICDKVGIVCGTGTAAMMPNFFNRWGERDTAYLTYGTGRAAFAGWQAWNLVFGDSVANPKISAVEQLLREEFRFKWFSIQRVGGRVVFVMTLRIAKRAYNVAPPIGGPAPTSNEWLWFEMPEGGTVTLTRNGSPTPVTLEVSLDNGATWSEWVEVGTARTQNLASGQVMHVRNASATSTGFSTSNANSYKFSFTNTTESGGNLDSLLCKNPNLAIHTNWCFTRLFFNEINLVKAPDLIQQNIALSSYNSMLRGCSIKEIELYAEIIPVYAYYNFMYGCSLLTKVTTRMTDITASDCITNWLGNVSPTGDFYCPSTLTIPTGSNGIPSGWTRHDL